ncbi:MAG TPA: cytochrome P450, partial [Vicinamibacteria bacterium]|nr:cytochrome P450 [Vicinamibacteria bacterium]
GFYARCAREYGDVVPFRLARRQVVMLNHPDAIEEVLVTQARHFTKTPILRLLRPLLGDGLLLSEGDVWLRQRRLVQPAFHRQRIAAFGDTMAALAERAGAAWKDGAVLDVHAAMMGLTQAIVAKTLFDADVTDEAHKVGDALAVLMDDFYVRRRRPVPLPDWLPLPLHRRSRAAVRELDRIVYRMIADRRRTGEDRGDLLSLLLQARDADDGRGMTDTQVRDEAMTLFLAGHETTAVALSWTWLLLAGHPAAEARLGAELDAVLGGRLPTVADLPKLKFAEAVIMESMRLYPPAFAVARSAARDCVVAGHRLAAGTICLMSQWVVQRDGRFFDDPEAFRPERWLGDLARRLPKYAYFPFGGGPRLCIGNTFATMEAILALATLARHFRLALAPGARVDMLPSVTLRPAHGLRMVVSAR